MPKPRPPYLTDHFYHFYNRGRSKLSIFHQPRDYLFLLQHLKAYTQDFGVTVISYCLLPNHYHFLLRQDNFIGANVVIQRLFNRYSKTYNKKYKHSGTIFEGNYQVKMAITDRYQNHLCRYIHANPVVHGFVKDPLDWPYSNYHEWLGLREGTLVDKAFIIKRFGSATNYQLYVEKYLGGDHLHTDHYL